MNRMEQFDDLIERMERALAELKGLAATALDGTTDGTVRLVRLTGKAEGVELALSYAREYRMCESASGTTGSAVRCLLSPGHEGWHQALGATWSGGAQ